MTWNIIKDGWVLMGDANQTEIVPVWSHPMFAEAFAVGEWLGYTPKKIHLEEWMTKWIPGMEKDHRMVAVFPASEWHPWRKREQEDDATGSGRVQ